MRFAAGDAVQTPLGKGVVAEVRNHGRLLVTLEQRAVVFDESQVTLAPAPKKSKRPRAAEPASRPESFKPGRGQQSRREIDLHGLTVEEALEAVERALNQALLDDVAELRVIHGRSGGRLRAALHQRLPAIPSVRAFRIDPRNAGVTIVVL